jgi:ATP-dependent helicase HrpA
MPSPLSTSKLKSLVSSCLCKDQHTFSRQLNKLRKYPDSKAIEALEAKINASRLIAEQRRSSYPPLNFPDLPISEKREEISELIANNQVLILCGETGSGKTTQLPKICLALGRGSKGQIGHTQPRRLAATSVAQRISDELNQPLGETVGYKIRFQARENPNTLVKLMTDGILLAEIKSDPYLSHYDTLIIDEAHERSLNIDFLIGYMKWLLPKRPDLKLIITSATIDPERFSKHFNKAPIINVSGRTYPVEIRYQPLFDESVDPTDISNKNMQQAIVSAAAQLHQERAGDILIFLSGEREIREAAEALRKHHPPGCEILPLFSRLSAKEQSQIFKPHKKSRIVLATNVAETSLTIPSIRCVIDTGFARISRYSHRSKLQRLPIEAISQASANQRSGRCGREAAGICIRLFSEDDFAQRHEFTEPEILRTNLASVILQMKSLRLSNISEFPFLEPPDEKMIRSGLRSLHELGALDNNEQLTPIGKQLTNFPLDPQLGRMLVAGQKLGCLDETLIIVSALSIQDPRERPLEKAKTADEKHALFQHDRSDFLAFINLWHAIKENKTELSNNQFRKYCRQHFLSYMRIKDWEDIYKQLSKLIQNKSGKTVSSADDSKLDYDNIHQALLTGLITRIGFKHDATEYLGARNVKFHLHPSSVLFKSKPKWVMAAEQVETTRVFGRTVAAIQPEWAEKCAPHLIKRQHYEPHWEKKAAQAMIYEQVMLFGLVIAKGRKIPLSRIDQSQAREMFIRSGLIERDIECHAVFFKHNQKLLETVEYDQQKGRRVDLLVDEEVLFGFYDQRLPDSIISLPALNKWLKKLDTQDKLKLTVADITPHDSQDVDSDKFPDTRIINGLPLTLSYQFEPGHPEDGVTVNIPLAQLNQLSNAHFEWLVPGLLEEKLLAIIKSLPKPLRKLFVPAPNTATMCFEKLEFGVGDLLKEIARILSDVSRQKISVSDFNMSALEPHLQMNFKLLDDKKKELLCTRNFGAIKTKYTSKANQSFQSGFSSALTKSGLKDWQFDDIPAKKQLRTKGSTLHAFPTLVDETDAVGLTYVDSQETADKMHKKGLIRLVRLKFSKELKQLRRKSAITPATALAYQQLNLHPHCKQDTGNDIFDDLEHQLILSLFMDSDIRTEAEFEQAIQKQDVSVYAEGYAFSESINKLMTLYKEVKQSLTGWSKHPELANDIKHQLSCLCYQGFVRHVSPERLRRHPQYIKAIQIRLDKANGKLGKDALLAISAQQFEKRFWAFVTKSGIEPNSENYRWLLEEFRISLFAQQIKTSQPISAKRLEKAWQALQQQYA